MSFTLKSTAVGVVVVEGMGVNPFREVLARGGPAAGPNGQPAWTGEDSNGSPRLAMSRLI
jgi:hypothetical protein